jgi:hypothetical protein
LRVSCTGDRAAGKTATFFTAKLIEEIPLTTTTTLSTGLTTALAGLVLSCLSALTLLFTLALPTLAALA